MWPMTHALYPGLNNESKRFSVETRVTGKPWYGSRNDSEASISSWGKDAEGRRRSHESVASSVGENMDDLVRTSQHVLSVLSLSIDGDTDTRHTKRDSDALSTVPPSPTGTWGGNEPMWRSLSRQTSVGGASTRTAIRDVAGNSFQDVPEPGRKSISHEPVREAVRESLDASSAAHQIIGEEEDRPLDLSFSLEPRDLEPKYEPSTRNLPSSHSNVSATRDLPSSHSSIKYVPSLHSFANRDLPSSHSSTKDAPSLHSFANRDLPSSHSSASRDVAPSLSGESHTQSLSESIYAASLFGSKYAPSLPGSKYDAPSLHDAPSLPESSDVPSSAGYRELSSSSGTNTEKEADSETASNKIAADAASAMIRPSTEHSMHSTSSAFMTNSTTKQTESDSDDETARRESSATPTMTVVAQPSFDHDALDELKTAGFSRPDSEVIDKLQLSESQETVKADPDDCDEKKRPDSPTSPELEKKVVVRVEEPAPEDASHLSGIPLVAVTLALSVAVFLVAMDVNVIATAIPHVTAEFRSLADIGWYGSAFLMTTCAFQILYGRIYTLFAAKWVFLSAILVFMLGSLIAAVSPSSPVFIVGRAIQGVGTSGILSGGLIIMSQVVPLRMRPVLGGIIGAMEGVAMISAPIIGGVLTDELNWRWCFYINLPIGGFVILVCLVCLRIPADKNEKPSANRSWREIARQLDLIGAALLLPPIVCALLALHYGGNDYPWSSPSIILLFVLSAVLFVFFMYSQHVNSDVAMIPLRVIRQRSVLAAFWFILCISSALVVITYFTVKGTTAIQSGIGILPMLIGVIVGVLVSGALVSHVGYYTPFMIASSIMMPIGLGLLTTITPDSGHGPLIAFPAIFGLGVGVGFQQPLIAVQASLSKEDIPIGTSIVVFGQTIGAAFIIAAGESVFQNRLVVNIEYYLGIQDINTQQILSDGTSSLAARLTQDQLPILLTAVNQSLIQTFYVSLVMSALSVFGAALMEWKSVKTPEGESDAQAV